MNAQNTNEVLISITNEVTWPSEPMIGPVNYAPIGSMRPNAINIMMRYPHLTLERLKELFPVTIQELEGPIILNNNPNWKEDIEKDPFCYKIDESMGLEKLTNVLRVNIKKAYILATLQDKIRTSHYECFIDLSLGSFFSFFSSNNQYSYCESDAIVAVKGISKISANSLILGTFSGMLSTPIYVCCTPYSEISIKETNVYCMINNDLRTRLLNHSLKPLTDKRYHYNNGSIDFYGTYDWEIDNVSFAMKCFQDSENIIVQSKSKDLGKSIC